MSTRAAKKYRKFLRQMFNQTMAEGHLRNEEFSATYNTLPCWWRAWYALKMVFRRL